MSPALLLNIKSLDFYNAADVAGYGLLLINVADKLGLISDSESSISTRTQINSLATQWVAGVESAITHMSPAQSLDILEPYDLVKRVILSREPNPDLIFKCINKALEASIHGDEEVNIYKLYNRISAGLRGKEKAYFGRPLDWNMIMLSGWHNEFVTGKYAGKASASDCDIISRTTILLSTDLNAFELDQQSFKKQLIANCRHYFDTVAAVYETWSAEAALDLDIKTVEALTGLLNASRPYLTAADYTRYHTSLRAALYDLTPSPYLRAALSPLPAA